MQQQSKENAEMLFDLVHGHADTFHNLAYKLSGISQWFKAFIQSPAFNASSDEIKAEAFENFEGLRFIVTHIAEVNLEPL